MKQILEDYAPILNAKQIEGEVISSESSSQPERDQRHYERPAGWYAADA